MTDYLKQAAGKWSAICRNLHIKSDVIEQLQTNNQDAPTRLDTAITGWLQLTNYDYVKFKKPTWRKVAASVCGVNNLLFLTIAREHTVEGELVAVFVMP